VADALRLAALGGAFVVAGAGCSSSSSSSRADAAPMLDAGTVVDGPASSDDAADAGTPTGRPGDAGVDAREGDSEVEGGLAADRFVTGVVSFAPGPCAGFNAGFLPGVVEGPPQGGGSDHGSTDVVSLGTGGTIVVSFGDDAIVDGPGPDFIVFENPFWVAGNPDDVFAEPGEVSVSDDGATWHTFPCAPAAAPQSSLGTGVAPPYGSCAGWHAVFSSPANGISPVDPAVAGGDAFDLADLGVTHARYVRIVDKTEQDCPDANAPDDNGFDLDAVSIVNAERP
jgi:hypothetical protein